MLFLYFSCVSFDFKLPFCLLLLPFLYVFESHCIPLILIFLTLDFWVSLSLSYCTSILSFLPLSLFLSLPPPPLVVDGLPVVMEPGGV